MAIAIPGTMPVKHAPVPFSFLVLKVERYRYAAGCSFESMSVMEKAVENP